jgi:DNA-binding transcriptional ArsR family regulator
MSNEMYLKLKRVFHEPSRLAIMSALAATDKGLTFSELKENCDLTDGNLSRHLKTLDDAGAIAIEKSFIGQKPRTTVFISEDGRDHFVAYLDALANVLIKASEALERPVQTTDGMEGARA